MIVSFLEHIGFIMLLIIVFFFNFKVEGVGKIKHSEIKKNVRISGK
jgi:hypothetical protein